VVIITNKSNSDRTATLLCSDKLTDFFKVVQSIILEQH